MKKIVVRVDDESTREDGVFVDTKPSLSTEEQIIEEPSKELALVEDNVETVKYRYFETYLY